MSSPRIPGSAWCREWTSRLVESLPQELRGTLPTIEEIEAELRDAGGESYHE